MSEIVSKIKYAMSLRTPQEEALSYLDAISSHCDYKKDSKDVVEAVASEYCEKQRLDFSVGMSSCIIPEFVVLLD